MLPTPPASPTPHAVACSPEDRIGQTIGYDLRLTGVLGVGAYGVVYSAKNVKTNVQYAVKALNRLGLDDRQRKFQDREILLHHQASQHPNVVSMETVINAADCTYVVLEYCPEGDLFTSITERGQYVGSDALAKRIFLQLLDAVEYCHSIGVYHRDLKPENLLLTNGGRTVKLADFGLATQDYLSSDFGCGSTFYMSPECNQPSPRPYSCYLSAPNDVWSLGVILVNLTCGRNPWKKASIADSTFNAYLQDSEFLKTILPLTDELDCILRRIFECDPAKRITLPELRNMVARCPTFTTTATTSSTTTEDAAASATASPRTQPRAHAKIAPQFSDASDCSSSASSQSDRGSVFSPAVSAGSSRSSSSINSFDDIAEDKMELDTKQDITSESVAFRGVSNVSGTWYSNFIPALDLAQRRMNFQPFFSSVRVF